MKKILLINDGIKTSNWGLQASSKALTTHLQSLNCNISFISHQDLHKVYTLDPFIFGKKFFNSESRLQRKVSSKYLNIPSTADQYELYVDLWSKGLGGSYSTKVISLIKENDIIIFNAEGSTYRKNHGALAGLFILYLASYVYKKKASFINGSISITSVDNVLEEIIKRVGKANVTFTVREPYSFRDMKKIGMNSKVIPDSVFYYSENTNKIITRKSNYFAVSKSMLPMLADFNYQKEDPFLKLIISITEKTKLYPMLLSIDPEDRILLSLKKYIPGAKNCNGLNVSFSKVQEIISKANFLISGRYHHLIFGANTQVPLCFLGSSSHKIHGLYEILTGSKNNNVYDPTNLNPKIEEITDYCKNLVSEKASWNTTTLKQQFIEHINQLISDY